MGTTEAIEQITCKWHQACKRGSGYFTKAHTISLEPKTDFDKNFGA